MKYTYFKNENMITVVDITTGEQLSITKDDSRFDKALDFLRVKDFESIFKMSIKKTVTSFFGTSNGSSVSNVSVTVTDGVGRISVNGVEYDLDDVITNKIVSMASEGLDPQPLVNFLGNLFCNPSATAVKELYLFLQHWSAPLTEDGCFIAYKLVRKDYKDIYTGTMDNSVGKVVVMPRFKVDDDRNNLCSTGLHFCSREYLPHYGGSDSRVVLVKINPADVVSIPADYNNAKGRCWRYEVVGEVTGGKNEAYKDNLAKSSVYTPKTFAQAVEAESRVSSKDVTYNKVMRRWQNKSTGEIVSRSYVCDLLGLSFEEVILYER